MLALENRQSEAPWHIPAFTGLSSTRGRSKEHVRDGAGHIGSIQPLRAVDPRVKKAIERDEPRAIFGEEVRDPRYW